MTTLYRLAKLICLGIIAYSLWRISQKDFVAKVTSDSPDDTKEVMDWLDKRRQVTAESRLEKRK